MGQIINPYVSGGGGGGAFLVEGVNYTAGGLRRGAGWTGAANSTLLSFMFWIRVITWTDGRRLYNATEEGAGAGGVPDPGLRVALSTGPNGFFIQQRNAANPTTTILAASTVNALSTNTWYCLMGSFDMNSTSTRHMYVGDSPELTVSSYNTGASFDHTRDDHSFFISTNNANPLDAEFGPVWYAPGQYIDFSVEANRRKFFSAIGKPVDLGTDGSTPTGTAPLAYFRCLDGEAASTYNTNRGTGGAFTMTGSINLTATSPSD